MVGIIKRNIINASFYILSIPFFILPIHGSRAADVEDKWCKSVKIRFFVGGSEGDAFGTIIYNGARQAAHDTGASVDYIFSGWLAEKMAQQLREAIAVHPDGIAMMGHPGEAAIMPLATQADAAGIKMIYLNVPVPMAQKTFGSSYIGAQQEPQGRALGEEIVRRFGFKAGDKAIVIGHFDDSLRSAREAGTAAALQAAGLNVIRLSSDSTWSSSPNLAIPVITAALQSNPDTKAIVYEGGQELGNAPTYMQAAGKKPGEIINIGFDTSPQIVDAFRGGWVQLTADQQPFQQGYMSVLSLCQQIVLGLTPVDVDTSAGFVTVDNYQKIATLASQGLR